jgi:putative tricarboxylic transport membrane protein
MLCAAAVHGADWKPVKAVEIIIPTTPGGAVDQTGRLFQKMLLGRIGVDVTVLNKGGAGGAIAYAMLAQKQGDGHALSFSTLNLITNPIIGTNPLGHNDVTAVCHLFGEYPVFLVRADSPYKTGMDLIARLRQDPAAVTITFSPGLGGALHLATAIVLKAASVDIRKLKLVVVQSSADGMTSVLGGHTDLSVVTPSNAVAQIQAGHLRALGVAAPQRMHGALAGVPTWKEQGVAGVSANWRGVIGPKSMTADQIRYWESTFAQLVKTPEWKSDLEVNGRTDEFMLSQDTRRYYDEQYRQLQAILAALGLAK